jgi:hypothetical protein
VSIASEMRMHGHHVAVRAYPDGGLAIQQAQVTPDPSPAGEWGIPREGVQA